MAEELKFTTRDFLSLRQEMIEFVKQRMGDSYTDTTESDEFITLIELLAYLGDNIHYYIDMQKRESDLITSSQLRNVYHKALKEGYKPRMLRAAEGSLTFTFTSALTNSVTVPRGTVFTTEDRAIPEDNQQVTTVEDFVIPAGSQTATIPVVSGTFYTETHTRADICEFGYITLANSDVASGYTKMTYLDNAWKEVDDSLTSFEIGKIFSIDPVFLGQDMYMAVQLPFNYKTYVSTDDVITIEYVRTTGASSNIASNRVTACTTILRDSLGNDITPYLSISNLQPIKGGADMESIESIKLNYKYDIRNLNTLVTLDDYKAFASFYTGTDCIAIDWSVDSTIQDHNKIYLLVPVTDSDVIAGLTTELASRRGRNDDILINDSAYTQFVDFNITATVYLKPTGDSQDIVDACIKKALTTFLEAYHREGKTVYVSQLIGLIQNANSRIDHVAVSAPSSDVSVSAWQIARLNTLSLTYS